MYKLSKAEEERALAIHRKAIVIDTHNDTIGDLMKGPPSSGSVPMYGARSEFTLRRSLGERSDLGHIDIPRIREGGVDCLLFCQCVSSFEYHNRRLRRFLQMVDVFHSELKKNFDNIALATTYKEVMDLAKEGKIAAILTVEGGEAMEGDLGMLRIFYQLGARSVTLCHFPRNELGDGSRDDSGSHLTDFGAEVVREMNRLGMVVDISHINEFGFWDVMKITKDPVIASHSNCKTICNHHRNLTDEQIKTIAEKGGVINLNYCPSFLKQEVAHLGTSDPCAREKVSLDDWFMHLDHIVKLVGADYVGLGSDFDGGCSFPGMDNITKVPNITRGLIYKGYSEEDIEKILGGNNLRVFKQVLK